MTGDDGIMSMIGYYYKANDFFVKRLQKGSAEEILFEEDVEKDLMCVDKAWHAIHFVLTGRVWDIPEDNVLGQMVLGGEPVSEEDFGYGPARLLSKETTAQIAEALKTWDEAVFRDGFNMEDLVANEVYPVMDGEDEGDFFTYVWETFAALKKYFEEAAEEGAGMVTFLA